MVFCFTAVNWGYFDLRALQTKYLVDHFFSLNWMIKVLAY